MTITTLTQAPRPRSGKTTYHRDGTVTLWDVYRQQWIRTGQPRDEVLASLGHEERERVIRHCRCS